MGSVRSNHGNLPSGSRTGMCVLSPLLKLLHNFEFQKKMAQTAFLLMFIRMTMVKVRTWADKTFPQQTSEIRDSSLFPWYYFLKVD